MAAQGIRAPSKPIVMAIDAELNSEYNPQGAIYEKYRPFCNNTISFDANGSNDIADIANNRILQLVKAWRQIYYLRFYGKDISGIGNLESTAGRKPPLAIVSSGRSAWIKTMYNTGQILLPTGQQHFNGIDDDAPFRNGDKIPIYLPYRLSKEDYDQRGIYIFVQAIEYDNYARDLAGTNITVIGYRVGMNEKSMFGFGASRYATIKFFSHIGVPKAWLIDDNILYIDKVSGFNVWEQKMNANKKLWALGGRGLASYLTDDNIKTIKKQPPLPAKEKPTNTQFLQQAVLWDINQLTANNDQNTSFNFSPYFIASGEDVSITYFLGKNRCKAFYDCNIYKGSPTTPKDLTDEQIQIKRFLKQKKEAIGRFISMGPQISIEKGGNLWNLLKSDGMLTARERTEYTYAKAGEQLLLKWMFNENKTWDANKGDLSLKLLNPLFNFTKLKNKDLFSLENEDITYDIALIDTTPGDR